jgi:polysaccharide export outer membrane protein
VTDARRALLLSSTRKLQTAAQLMQIKRQQDDYSRQLERLDDQRRMRLLQDLQDTRIRLGAIRAKLQGIGEKLQYTGVMKSELIRGSSVKPRLLVLRKGAKGWERSVVEEDSELQPGDIVEVSLPAPYPVSLAGH